MSRSSSLSSSACQKNKTNKQTKSNKYLLNHYREKGNSKEKTLSEDFLENGGGLVGVKKTRSQWCIG